MTLHEDIIAAQTAAMKEQRKDDLATLRLLTTALKNEQIAKGGALTDDDVRAVVKRQVKQLRDASEDFQRAGREDLLQQTEKEIVVMSGFLPEELSDDALQEIVTQTLATMSEEDKQNLGRVMGAVMKAVNGQADGARVRAIVTTTLNS